MLLKNYFHTEIANSYLKVGYIKWIEIKLMENVGNNNKIFDFGVMFCDMNAPSKWAPRQCKCQTEHCEWKTDYSTEHNFCLIVVAKSSTNKIVP